MEQSNLVFLCCIQLQNVLSLQVAFQPQSSPLVNEIKHETNSGLLLVSKAQLLLLILHLTFLCLSFIISARHEVITKEILELDTWENQWNVVAVNVLMHDSYDICLVAQLNPRDLIPPPPDLVEQ